MKFGKTINDNVVYDKRNDYSAVVEIGGYLNCSGADTKASFPKLTTVGGDLYCDGADTKASFPKLTTVGGDLDCYGADTKASFPKLTTKNMGVGNKKAKTSVSLAFKKEGFFLFDGILSFIKGTRTKGGLKIHKTIIVGQLKASFCLEADGVFSHGKTIREAKESLLYKIGDRDKSDYGGWDIKTKITKREAIESYRVITGACESGVRNFVELAGKTKPKYTVKEIIDITKGQYGNDTYRNFFNGKI